MRYFVSALILMSLSFELFAQQENRIDTTYFDSDWNMVPDKAFADFYLITLTPADPNAKKLFRVFYIDGTLRTRGGFIYLDPANESKDIYDGTLEKYYKNGKVEARMNYVNGKLNGPYTEYFENGLIKVSASYINGQPDGQYFVFYDDGSYRIDDYAKGEFITDYYIYGSTSGVELKVDRKNNGVIWDSPQRYEKEIVYRDGLEWSLYHKNGITVALTNDTEKKYGDWYRIGIIITNDSPLSIEFDPAENVKAYSYGKGSKNPVNLTVWSAVEYVSMLKRKQDANTTMNAIASGLGAAAAGYSTTASVGTLNYNGNIATISTVSTTYDRYAAYQASVMARQMNEEFNEAQWRERNSLYKNYLKKNTIHPGESITGFFMVAQHGGQALAICLDVDVENAEYPYKWILDSKKANGSVFTDWDEYADSQLIQIEELVSENKKAKALLLISTFNDWYQRGTYIDSRIEERLDNIYKDLGMKRKPRIRKEMKLRDSDFKDGIYK